MNSNTIFEALKKGLNTKEANGFILKKDDLDRLSEVCDCFQDLYEDSAGEKVSINIDSKNGVISLELRCTNIDSYLPNDDFKTIVKHSDNIKIKPYKIGDDKFIITFDFWVSKQ